MSDFQVLTAWKPATQTTEESFDAAEDKATLAEIGVAVGDAVLTLAITAAGERRQGPRASACRLAEWLAWHWWRLRWEPSGSSHSVGWHQAHDMACIGGGWLWPNITISSDGYRMVLHAKPSPATPTEPLRYLSDMSAVVSGALFEQGVDAFMALVLRRLADSALSDSQLSVLRRELQDDRQDADSSEYRKIEACLGADPGEGDPTLIRQIIASGNEFGLEAMEEVAADNAPMAAHLRETARRSGIAANPSQGAGRNEEVLWDRTGSHAPWRVGVAAAKDVRTRTGLGGGSIGDARLADLCGVSDGDAALRGGGKRGRMAFSMRGRDGYRIVLRAAYRTGRRFELARLLGDRLLVKGDDRLRPATRVYTYRQKMQRAFAAELLCPIDSLRHEMDGDYSEEAIERAARHFSVSPLLVHRQLAHNGLVSSGQLDIEMRSVVLAA